MKRVHGVTAESLARHAEKLNELADAVKIKAKEHLGHAANRYTDEHGVEEWIEQAKVVLRDVLKSPSELEELYGKDSKQLLENLAAVMKIEGQDPDWDDEWLERRAADIAHSVVRFWWNLDEDDEARKEKAWDLLSALELEGLCDSEVCQDFTAIYRPFGLTQADAGDLLRIVQNTANRASFASGEYDAMQWIRNSALN